MYWQWENGRKQRGFCSHADSRAFPYARKRASTSFEGYIVPARTITATGVPGNSSGIPVTGK